MFKKHPIGCCFAFGMLQQSQAAPKEVQEELEQSKRKVTQLNENRAEIIWLLKQAIFRKGRQPMVSLTRH
jgi:hypothetical protein